MSESTISSFFFDSNTNTNIYNNEEEHRTLSILQSTFPSYSSIPGIVFITLWSFYLLILTIFKFTPIPKFKHTFCFFITLGGNLSPQAFQLNNNVEQELTTIVESDDVCMQGLSYEKYRYTTLASQMRKIRKIFMSLGLAFGLISIPTTMCILYYTFIFSTIYDRVNVMRSRMDFVNNTMNVLMDHKYELFHMSEDIVESISSTDVQSCFQGSGNDELVQTSEQMDQAMSSLVLNDDDVNEMIESVSGASVLSNEVIDNYNGYFALIWISIIAITLVNGVIVVLMNGVKEARNDSCSPKHFLINNTIAYPLMILFTTFLWIALAAYGFGVVVNGDFCGDSTNDSVLDLISAIGYEFSMFYYYAQDFMEGCNDINEFTFGSNIASLSDNLRNSIENATRLQDLMSSLNSCSAFNAVSSQINDFNEIFGTTMTDLNTTTYIIDCGNVNQWYNDISVRATCADLPRFGGAVFGLLLILALIASVMTAFTIALRTDVDLFLDICSEEQFIDGQRVNSKSRLVLSSRRVNVMLNEMGVIDQPMEESSLDLQQQEIEEEIKYRKGLLRRKKKQDERKQKKIEALKRDLDKIMLAEHYQQQPVSPDLRVKEDIQQQLHPQNINEAGINVSPQRLTQMLNLNQNMTYTPPQKRIDEIIPDEVVLKKFSESLSRPSTGSKSKHSQSHEQTDEKPGSNKSFVSSSSSAIQKNQHHSQNQSKNGEKAQEKVNRWFSKGKNPIQDLIKEEIGKQMNLQNDYKLKQVKSTELIVKEEIEKHLKNDFKKSLPDDQDDTGERSRGRSLTPKTNEAQSRSNSREAESESRNGGSKHRSMSATRSSKSNGGKINEPFVQKASGNFDEHSEFSNSGMIMGMTGKHDGEKGHLDRKDFIMSPRSSTDRGPPIQNNVEADPYNNINVEHFSIEEEKPPVKISGNENDIRYHDHQTIELTIEDVEENNERESYMQLKRNRMQPTPGRKESGVETNTPSQFASPGNVDTTTGDGAVVNDHKEQSFNENIELQYQDMGPFMFSIGNHPSTQVNNNPVVLSNAAGGTFASATGARAAGSNQVQQGSYAQTFVGSHVHQEPMLQTESPDLLNNSTLYSHFNMPMQGNVLSNNHQMFQPQGMNLPMYTGENKPVQNFQGHGLFGNTRSNTTTYTSGPRGPSQTRTYTQTQTPTYDAGSMAQTQAQTQTQTPTYAQTQAATYDAGSMAQIQAQTAPYNQTQTGIDYSGTATQTQAQTPTYAGTQTATYNTGSMSQTQNQTATYATTQTSAEYTYEPRSHGVHDMTWSNDGGRSRKDNYTHGSSDGMEKKPFKLRLRSTESSSGSYDDSRSKRHRSRYSASYSHSSKSYSSGSYSDSGSSDYYTDNSSYSDDTGSSYSRSDESSYESRRRSRRQRRSHSKDTSFHSRRRSRRHSGRRHRRRHSK